MNASKKSTKKPSKRSAGEIIMRFGEMYLVQEVYNDASIDALRIDKEEYVFMFESEANSVLIKSLGSSEEATVAFYAARSVHLRLNRMKP